MLDLVEGRSDVTNDLKYALVHDDSLPKKLFKIVNPKFCVVLNGYGELRDEVYFHKNGLSK